jgi:hypothetical protein
MKKLFLILTISLSALGVSAQNYESIKNLLIFPDKFAQAKTDLDKGFGNTKFASKPEAYILKTAIYAGLAMSDANKNTPAGDQLNTEADAAFTKYKEMDPAMSLISDPIYQNGPINIYSSFYSGGYNDYAAKKWQDGFSKLKKAVEYSDLLIDKKILSITMDTNVLVLAAITAENSGNKDDAAKLYGRLADSKIGGDGFESVYRFLVSYSFGKKDMAAFEKYKALGASLYPKSEYFNFDKIDFAVGLVEGFDDKVKALEEALVSDPTNFKANQILGEIIYDTLNTTTEGVPPHSNEAALEAKMVAAFNKAAAAKPGFENPYIYIADHFINKAAKVGEARDAHAKDMKAKLKPGTKSSPEDIAKRDMLDKKYGDALESAREPYEKAAAIFAEKPKSGDKNQEQRDKQQYKKACSYLTDIYMYKKQQAKANPKDAAKFEAEEKKWTERYDSIK